MTQTYTSDTLTVSRGGVTTHDPRTNNGGEDVDVTNVECRWQGITTTTEEQRSNYDASSGEKQFMGPRDLRAIQLNPDNVEYGPTYELIVELTPLPPDATITFDYALDGEIQQDNDTRTGDSTGQVYRQNIDSEYDTVSGVVTVEGIPSDVSWTMNVTLRAFDYYTVTVDHYTTDPYVTRDVDGSYTGQLSDGEWSPWMSLDGLANGTNEFYHVIDDSKQANFEFRYDWEPAYPDPVNGVVGFPDESENVWREAAVADPTDPQLEYNHVTVYNPTTDAWGTLDVVDVSDSDAISGFEFYDPDVGWLAPRESQTTPM